MGETTRSLTGKEKFAYGIGAVGKDMVYMLSASYILYYYQDILGIEAWIMGIILLIARVFDAFNDPIMGVIVAKTKTRWGKFRPWLFIGTITNAVILYLMFACPPTLSGSGLVAYAAVFYILWGVTYTMMDIPYWSMVPAFTKGGKEREGLSALARSCAGVGSAIVTIVTVMAVSAIGSSVSANSSTNVTNTYTSSTDAITAYIVELDEASVATGNVYEIGSGAGNITLNITADASEFEDNLSLNANNTDFKIVVGSKEYDNSNATFDLTKDVNGEAAIAVYVPSSDFEQLKDVDAISADITSTRQVERYGFKYFSLIIAVLFVVFITITCVGIKEKSTVDVKTAGVGEMFKALVMNDQAMTMVITIVLVNSATYITSNLLIYFFKYDLAGANWEANYTLFNTFAGGIQILAMMLLFPLLRKVFNTMKIFDICIYAGIVGYIVLLGLALAGVTTVYPFLVPGFFIMAAVGILNVIVTVFLANTVDYGELKNGRRDESVIFSMQTFVVKLASGIAALIASIALSVFHISDTDSAIAAVDGSVVKGLKEIISGIIANGATVVSNNDIVGLRLTMTLAPIFVLVVAFTIFKKKYILTDEKLAEISNELATKKA